MHWFLLVRYNLVVYVALWHSYWFDGVDFQVDRNLVDKNWNGYTWSSCAMNKRIFLRFIAIFLTIIGVWVIANWGFRFNQWCIFLHPNTTEQIIFNIFLISVTSCLRSAYEAGAAFVVDILQCIFYVLLVYYIYVAVQQSVYCTRVHPKLIKTITNIEVILTYNFLNKKFRILLHISKIFAPQAPTDSKSQLV